jgi:hypothetical protein
MCAIRSAASLLLVLANTSHASLGAAPSFSNPNSLKSASPAQKYAVGDYSELETTLPTGTRVREYVSVTGKVFAVSWSGPFMPDLKELLGTYFDTMVTESSKSPAAGNSQLDIKRPDVVIQSGGHMRALEGRAWIPDQLPKGFSASDIR